MANPTTNFGWVMPTSTSLVTNLPADFNTFGQGVDTSMAQLKGGTTGQILSKTSATDMAFTWITNDVGDITAVTAGTGISVSGTYPSFTIANTGVTSVTGTSPVVSSGGSTPAISMPAATSSVNGYLTSTDWTTFNSKANAFTYTTNYIPYGQGTTTPTQSANLTFDGTTQTAPIQRASNGIVTNNKTIGTSFTIPSTDNAMSSGPVTLSSGVTVTVSSGSRWVVL
jgi:hypothetical protein